MDKSVAQKALDKMKIDHRNFGLMLGEMEVALLSFEGGELLNAIDDITARYGMSGV
jgi:hypothetical protein